MDNVLAKINAVKERVIFGGIIFFIFYILIGIFACIADTGNSSSYVGSLETFSKFLSTTIMIGICLLCLLDNLNKISNKNQICRIFAIVSLIAIPIFLVLYCLGTWGVIPLVDIGGKMVNVTGSGAGYSTSPNIISKLITTLGTIVSLGTVSAITMSIKPYGRKVIEVSKIIATIALTVAALIEIYLAFAGSSILSLYATSSLGLAYTLVFCFIAWVSLTVLAFYLSKFDNGVVPTPVRPLNAKVVSASAPAVLTVEEVKEEKAETIYPEPTNVPIHHVDGVNLNVPVKEPKPEGEPEKTPAPKPEKPETIMPEEHHDDAPLHASPGEPLFEEHPTIGPATSGTQHDEFDSLDSQENENKEVL